MSVKVGIEPQNKILADLSSETFQTVRSSLELIDLDIRDVAYEANEPVEFCYFPVSCVISIVAQMENGLAVEAATVGNEGVIGLPLVLRADTSSTRAFCQVPGRAWRMSAKDFRSLLTSDTQFSLKMHRYAQTMFDLVAQTAACNRLHTIEERCARWLLLVHDRTNNSPSFLLTQEFLAQMLGVRRSGVNLAAGVLQKAQLITYIRGKVRVLNRKGLEEVSCECYRMACKAFAKDNTPDGQRA